MCRPNTKTKFRGAIIYKYLQTIFRSWNWQSITFNSFGILAVFIANICKAVVLLFFFFSHWPLDLLYPLWLSQTYFPPSYLILIPSCLSLSPALSGISPLTNLPLCFPPWPDSLPSSHVHSFILSAPHAPSPSVLSWSPSLIISLFPLSVSRRTSTHLCRFKVASE